MRLGSTPAGDEALWWIARLCCLHAIRLLLVLVLVLLVLVLTQPFFAQRKSASFTSGDTLTLLLRER